MPPQLASAQSIRLRGLLRLQCPPTPFPTCRLVFARLGRPYTSPSKIDLHDSKPLGAKEDADVRDVALDESSVLDEHTSTYTARPPRPPRSNSRSKRLYSGRLVSVQSHDLGVAILGKPAHAIVMREKKEQPSPLETIEETSGAASPSLPHDLEPSLWNHDAQTTFEESRRNIAELRPLGTQTLGEQDYNALVAVIHQGFTAAQLDDYITHYAQENHLTLNSTNQSINVFQTPSYPWIIKQLAWQPSISKPQSRTSKGKLVEIIMRQCWHIELLEEAFGIGTLEVKVGSRVLSLLLRNDAEYIELMRRRFLSPQEKIEVLLSRKRIQISASKVKSMAILDKLNTMVQHIKETTFPLHFVGNNELPVHALEELGKITNTWLNYTSNTPKEIRVGWIEEEPLGEELEKPNHVVMRLMSTALCATPRPKNIIADEDPTRAKLIYESRGKEKWGWLHRLGHWYRLTAPLPLSTGEEAKLGRPNSDTVHAIPDHAMHNSQLQDILEEGDIVSTRQVPLDEAVETNEEQPGSEKIGSSASVNGAPSGSPALTTDDLAWRLGSSVSLAPSTSSQERLKKSWAGPTIETTATYGHLLHHHTGPRSTKIQDIESHFDVDSISPALLSPIIPPLFSFTNLPPISNPPIDPHTSIICRFRPHPSHNDSISKYAPELELHLTPAADKQHDRLTWEDSEKRLIAISNSRISNIMVPSAPVDFQISQRLTFEMGADTLAKSSPLKKFIESSILDLAQGTLLTPPILELPINRALFTDRIHAAASNGTHHAQDEPRPQTERLDNPNLKILYMFTGLELRQTGVETYLGHHLRYSSIEAGHHGGRRCEISLEFDPNHAKILETGEYLLSKDFLDTAFDLATGKHFSWIGTSLN